MMKINVLLLTFILSISIPSISLADEGMWIPMLLKKYNEKDMQEMGMKLSADDIYNINHTSLKDAIVIFGGGCTGALVSDQGLLLTNHHCGYGSIQRHSSLENDYLTDGFWAMSREKELPNPGLRVTFLVRMDDVTARVLEGIDDNMREKVRDSIVRSHIDAIVRSVEDTSGYKVVIRPFYHGNQYYMFINEVFKDVRLVGAPPSNIGKFGGDTDNWMWPRHTGDFSVFRIYADSNNKPAPYSDKNVPYKPKYFFPVSLKGVDKGDFTMVFGYPGSTEQYIPSFAIEPLFGHKNPLRIEMRGKVLDIYNKYINQDDLIRIQYASKSAGVANSWKKWIGENRGILRTGIIERKQQQEREFIEWAGADSQRAKKYAKLLPEYEKVYEEITPLDIAMTYVTEVGFRIEILRYALGFRRMVEASEKGMDDTQLATLLESYHVAAQRHFKDYQEKVDKEVFITLLTEYYRQVEQEFQPTVFREIAKKYNGDIKAYAGMVFEKSFLASEEKVLSFLDTYKPSAYKKILKDPAYKLASDIYSVYQEKIIPDIFVLYDRADSLQRIYMKALMEFEPERRFYPDANSTLRVSYGPVMDYSPADGVEYGYYTTLDGIMEKENPDIYDYVVEDKLKELYREEDYGRYADKDGSLRVCFTAMNHTSGGNSGSPVINATGELIGLNFDRCWEGTMSDIVYDPEQCRNISLDIRYCLFIMDKFAGAGHLVEEMEVVE
ncbi:MAG: S46 family peptidase [Bacteroidetes bacterium]|nr:S46 family peptidase [Bacteroidota bacterium]